MNSITGRAKVVNQGVCLAVAHSPVEMLVGYSRYIRSRNERERGVQIR